MQSPDKKPVTSQEGVVRPSQSKEQTQEQVLENVPPSPEVLANRHIYDEYFDLELGKCFAEDIMELIDGAYFRSRLIDLDPFPKRNNPKRPLIFASNHSGMAFPWDGIVWGYRIHKHCNYGPDGIRALTAPMLSASVLMHPYQIKYFWKRMGAVDATFLNFETMMHQNDFNVMIYPEGVPGIGKGFHRRYQLQRFSSSMVHMSIKYKTDIIPFYTVNGEYINPYSYCSNFLNKLVNLIGIPFLPLGFITPFILLFPWIFYMAFPARLTFIKGKRIKPYEMTDKPYEEMTYEDFRAIADKIRDMMQKELNEAVKKYGQKPYDWKSFFKAQWKWIRYFPYTLPIGWPLLFAEWERVRIKKGDRKSKLKLGFLSTLRILFKNPKVIAYYLPLIGWIPLGISGFRRLKP
ncbi:MAG: hypothetical protein KatS3mg033_0981 [Thermonema sp.]|uniref:hypothetical protein n=1 Tax=Thermonema sp. TaxID=2231181 RepID=UPI0021DF0C80|nr:hypothetical protein [Thermonema sp.]GIV39181.1 MAG: hypothetical protein KatS3mg033_0981 [Thermonema sp.]